MTAMTDLEKQEFLAGLHVGVLGIGRPARAPLTVPIWYDYRPGGDLWFITGRASVKGRLLEVGTVVAMCVQDEDVPYRYVTVEGPVTSIEETEDELLPMAVRYLGEDMGSQYAGQSGGDDSVVVRIRPERWLGVDYSKRRT